MARQKFIYQKERYFSIKGQKKAKKNYVSKEFSHITKILMLNFRPLIVFSAKEWSKKWL